jgi:hypothetical protein
MGETAVMNISQEQLAFPLPLVYIAFSKLCFDLEIKQFLSAFHEIKPKLLPSED